MPLLKKTDGDIKELDHEALRKALSDGTLLVCGAKLWNALHSSTWRHREAAAQAFLDFISGPLKEKYIGKTKKLFLAAMEIARVACMDKLLQVYFIGLKIMTLAMSPPICGPEIPAKVVNQQVKYFVPLLITKIEELNYRAKDLSLNNLVSIFRHPSVDIRLLIEGIMDITEKGKPPDKVEWRKIHSRLEILKHIISEFGVNERAWDWRIVF
jgi:centrosomal protein CEP104